MVLARRRLLAALLLGLATAAGLRALSPPEPPQVEVLVASRDLAAGTVLTDGDVRSVGFPRARAPTGLVQQAVGRALAAPLRAGEPVTDVRLVGPSLLAEQPGLAAVPVRLPDAGAVALLTVGDRIDLLAAHPRSGQAEVLVGDALVLALPPEPVGAAQAATSGRLVVLGVPGGSVTAVANAAVQDFLSFAYSR